MAKRYKDSEHAGGGSGAIYRRLLQHAWPYRWVFLIGVLGMFAGGAAEASFAALLKPIMDEGFVNRDEWVIRMTPVFLIGVFLIRGIVWSVGAHAQFIRGIAGFIDAYCVQWVGRKVIFDLRKAMFKRMIRLPMTFFDQSSTSELVSKLIFDVEQVAQASTTAVRIFFKDTFTVDRLSREQAEQALSLHQHANSGQHGRYHPRRPGSIPGA